MAIGARAESLPVVTTQTPWLGDGRRSDKKPAVASVASRCLADSGSGSGRVSYRGVASSAGPERACGAVAKKSMPCENASLTPLPTWSFGGLQGCLCPSGPVWLTPVLVRQ